MHALVNDGLHLLYHIEIYLIVAVLDASLSPWNRGTERGDDAAPRVERCSDVGCREQFRKERRREDDVAESIGRRCQWMATRVKSLFQELYVVKLTSNRGSGVFTW